MAKIINVEKSQYLNENIQIYSSNKVGQYSKYLDKNPLFITYFHINSAESRSDIGTGGLNADIGPNSPIRFNQINNLPVYNFPDLKPNTEFGENGYDIEMDLSDLVLLPGTIKPVPGDYLLVQLPDTIEFVFRVNEFGYNTIQSNDFYTFSVDLKYTGHDLINKFKSQIVQVYETIFENIGTDDKCFILSEDVEKIQNIAKLFDELRNLYKDNFFDKETGTFVCKNYSHTNDDAWLYDKYLEKFIMESKIYYTENDENSMILTCADITPQEMQPLYTQSLFYSVLNRNTDYLADYPYYYPVDIQKSASPFKIYGINCKSVNLVLTKNALTQGHSDMIDSGFGLEYFSHQFIQLLKGNITIDDITNKSNEPSDRLETERVPTPDGGVIYNVYRVDEKQSENSEELTYLEMIIYQYMQNQMNTIDRDKLIPYALQVDNYTYKMMPLVMYVIMEYYHSYFKKEEL